MQENFIKSRCGPLLDLCLEALVEIKKNVLRADYNTVTKNEEFSTKSTVCFDLFKLFSVLIYNFTKMIVLETRLHSFTLLN